MRAERELALGEPLSVVALTGSTNDDAMAAARAGAAHGATFVADQQTKGRGRRGAAWLSQPAESLLCSVVLRPKLRAAEASTLTLATGLAVRDVAQARVGAQVRVKWPNDVVVEGRKLAGILLESQLTGGEVGAVVAGVGLNLVTCEFPAELATIATSLAVLGARDVDRESVLADLLAALERRVRVHEANGLAAVLDELRAHDALFGKRVQVDALSGVASGIAADGSLFIDDEAGERHAVSSGSVVVL